MKKSIVLGLSLFLMACGGGGGGFTDNEQGNNGSTNPADDNTPIDDEALTLTKGNALDILASGYQTASWIATLATITSSHWQNTILRNSSSSFDDNLLLITNNLSKDCSESGTLSYTLPEETDTQVDINDILTITFNNCGFEELTLNGLLKVTLTQLNGLPYDDTSNWDLEATIEPESLEIKTKLPDNQQIKTIYESGLVQVKVNYASTTLTSTLSGDNEVTFSHNDWLYKANNFSIIFSQKSDTEQETLYLNIGKYSSRNSIFEGYASLETTENWSSNLQQGKLKATGLGVATIEVIDHITLDWKVFSPDNLDDFSDFGFITWEGVNENNEDGWYNLIFKHFK